MQVDIQGLNQPLAYSYRYDQLHRLKRMHTYPSANNVTAKHILKPAPAV